MSNHYHLVLRVKPGQAGQWESAEVVKRWGQLFSGSVLVDRYLLGDCSSSAERDKAEEVVNRNTQDTMPSPPPGALALPQLPPAPLAPFIGGGGGDPTEAGLPFELADYLALVDWTGRQWRDDKRGAIGPSVPRLLTRLNVNETGWIDIVHHFQGQFHDVVGPAEAIEARSRSLGRRWLRGVRTCRRLWQ
jgi:hypothetical protein